MTVIAQLLSLAGWRGLVGVFLGAGLVMGPAFLIGKAVGGAGVEARVEAALSAARVRQLETQNERIREAQAARHAADSGNTDGSGLSEDRWRRD